MRNFAWWLAIAVWLVAAQAAVAAENGGVNTPDRPGPTAGLNGSIVGKPNGAAATNELWRYRWHEGRWWYYLPNNQWVWWDGAEWSARISPPRQELDESDWEYAIRSRTRRYWPTYPMFGGYNWGRQDVDVYPNRD